MKRLISLFFATFVFLGSAEHVWGQSEVALEGSPAPNVEDEVAQNGEYVFTEEEDDDIFPKEIDLPEADPDILTVPDAQVKLSLEDCLKMASLNNKEVKAASYDLEMAQHKLGQAKIRFIPTIEYKFDSAPAPKDASRAVDSFLSGDLTYLQRGSIFVVTPFYSFGKIGLAQNLARVGINAEIEKKFEKQNDTQLNVKKLYFGILLAKDLQKLLKDAAKQMKEEIIRRTESEDSGDPVQLVRLKLYRYEVLSRLSEVQKKGYLAKEGLRVQMGLPEGMTYDLVEKNLKPVKYELKDFKYYLAQSEKYRPKKKLLGMGLKAKELKYRLEKRKAAPDVGIGAGFEFGVTTSPVENVGTTNDFNDPFNYTRVIFGLRIQGNFNPISYREKVRESRADYYKTAMIKGAADQGLELDLKEAYLSAKHGKKNVENAKNSLKAARQFVFITKTNIDIGVGSEKDYSDALQTYLLSRARYLEAIFSYNVAVATLESKMGGVAVPKLKKKP